MNPLSLKARCYRTFETLELDLPEGTVAITGPNGSGKSSLINICDLCLFGPESRSLAPYLTDDAEGTELEIELVFEHAGQVYRARRGYSSRGRGKTTLDFEVDRPLGAHDEAEFWHPLTREDQKATQALIEETIGMTRATFRASVFLAQADGAAFTEADPKQRKAILAEVVLGRDPVWPKLAERARADRRLAEQQIAELEGAVGRALEELARLPDVLMDKGELTATVVDVARELTAAEQQLAGVVERYRAVEARAAERRTAEAELQAAITARDTLLETRKKADAAKAALPELDAEITRLEALVAAKAAVEGRNQALVEALTAYQRCQDSIAVAQRERDGCAQQETEAHDLATRLRARSLELQTAITAQLEAPDARCQTCDQPIHGDAKAKAINELRALDDQCCAQASEADAAAGRMHLLVEEGNAKIATAAALPEPPPLELLPVGADTAAGELGAACERRLLFQQKIADADTDLFRLGYHAAEEACTAAKTKLVGLPAVDQNEAHEIQQAGLLARAKVEQEKQRLAQARDDLTRATAELERLQALQARTETDRQQVAAHHAEVDLVAILEKAYGRDGIPSLIVEATAIPQIEIEANRVLAHLGGKTAGARIELRTQRALKTSDALADTLDIIVITDHATERAYEQWSGGEKTRLNLALRLALAHVLATRRGASCPMLVIDEPDGLDAEGKAGLVDLLREAHTRGIEKVVLISHDPGLRDVFDQTIEVATDAGGHSEIVGSPITEGVAA